MEAITFGPAVVHGFADAMMLLMMVMITEIERQDSSSRTASDKTVLTFELAGKLVQVNVVSAHQLRFLCADQGLCLIYPVSFFYLRAQQSMLDSACALCTGGGGG